MKIQKSFAIKDKLYVNTKLSIYKVVLYDYFTIKQKPKSLYTTIICYTLMNVILYTVKKNKCYKLIVCFTRFILIFIMDILLLKSYTRILCSQKKLNMQRAKITIPPFQRPVPQPLPSYWMNKLTNKQVPCQQAISSTIFSLS